MQPIALVGIFADAGFRIDTVVGFEVLGELININRLDVTTNGVLHLDAITRILKSNPLHTIVVLAYDKRCSSRNRTWCYAFVSERADTRRSADIPGPDGVFGPLGGPPMTEGGLCNAGACGFVSTMPGGGWLG